MRALKITAVCILYAIVAAGLFWAHSAWATLLAFHAWMLATLLLSRPPIPVRRLLEIRSFRSLLSVFAVMGASSGLLLYLLWPILVSDRDVSSRLASLGLTSKTLLSFMIYFALVNPWIEEYFWRGYLGSPSKGIVPTDLAFAGYHLLVAYGLVGWPWLLLMLLVLALVSWLWRQASRLSDGLLIASVSHLAADASILSIVYMMASKG